MCQGDSECDHRATAQIEIECSALEATNFLEATGRQTRVYATRLRATFSGRTGPNRPEDLGAIERVRCINTRRFSPPNMMSPTT
jgi:hypothetical protein